MIENLRQPSFLPQKPKCWYPIYICRYY